MLQERLEIHFIYFGDVPYLQQAKASLHSAVLWQYKQPWNVLHWRLHFWEEK